MRSPGELSLVIRADATPRIGAGHAMRCLNLAEGWSASGLGASALHGVIELPFARQRASSLGIELAPPVRAAPTGDVLVVDSYDDDQRRRWAVEGEFRLRVLVDDLGGSVPDGYGVVWNPNPYGESVAYPGFRGVVLGGPDLVPVRSDLPRWSGSASPLVAVALGGASISGELLQALRILGDLLPEQSFLGVGAWVPAGWSKCAPDRPWDALAACGAILVAGGTSAWEAAAVGIPACVVLTADNQRLSVDWAAARGVPTVDTTDGRSSEATARALAEGVCGARPLPRLQSAGRAVALRLASLLPVGTR